MIADFLFSEIPIDGAVMVYIASEPDGASSGEILVPIAVVDDLLKRGFVSVEGSLPMECAVAYGIFVAGKVGRSLVLTGDRLAWHSTWGNLIDVRERLPLQTLSRPSEETVVTRH